MMFAVVGYFDKDSDKTKLVNAINYLAETKLPFDGFLERIVLYKNKDCDNMIYGKSNF